MARTFFRIVRTNPPTREDFKSHEELGRPLANPTPERLELWRSVSVFATEAQARSNAQEWPMIGKYIVELRIADNGPIRWKRTGRKPGHYSLSGGEPDVLIACIVGEVTLV